MSKNKGKKSISDQESEFYFDNCPICQAMKKAEDEGRSLTSRELEEAFNKAKQQGAVVGKCPSEEEKQVLSD